MKDVRFSWAWSGQADKPDPLMTRPRAALLLREWRKDRGMTVTAQRVGRIRAYTVRTNNGGSALMVINGGAA